MQELLAARKRSIALGDDGKDLISLLIKGNDNSKKEGESLGESAMMGNFFIFLVGKSRALLSNTVTSANIQLMQPAMKLVSLPYCSCLPHIDEF